MRTLALVALLVAAASPAAADDELPETKISKIKRTGARTTRAVTKQLRAVRDHLGTCKAADPDLASKHAIAIEIAADGTVAVLSPDPTVEPGACFARALARMKVASAKRNTVVRFTATFVSRIENDLAEAERFADLLTAEGGSSGAAGDMSRSPGASLDQAITEVREGGSKVAIGGGGSRGGHEASASVAMSVKITAGSRTTDEVKAAYAGFLTAARRCHRDHPDAKQTTARRLTVAFSVDASGITTGTPDARSDAPAALRTCLDRAIDASDLDDSFGLVTGEITLTFTP